MIEDDPEVAAFLKELLRSHGYICRHAANGAAALAALAAPGGVRYDAVMLDWELPFYAGGVLLRLIRQKSQDPELPVVVLTGSARPEDRENALALGVSAFLTKSLS
jgi:CheY-like chemotaxis protein